MNRWSRLALEYVGIFVIFYLALAGLGGGIGPVEFTLAVVLLVVALVLATIRTVRVHEMAERLRRNVSV